MGQTAQTPGQLVGAISHRQFTPLLRSEKAALAFSPDGRYLLAYDNESLYLLSREPLKVLGEIVAPNSYPPRFSADSQDVLLVSRALTYQRWSIRQGQLLENKELPIADGCVDGQLSPDGALFACYRADFSLDLWRLATNERIFSEKLFSPDPHLGVMAIDLNLDIPFGDAFGFTLAHDLNLLTNRGVGALPIAFSPSGNVMLAGGPGAAIRVDTVAAKKAKLPGTWESLLAGSVALLDDDRALAIPPGKPTEPAVRSLSDGKVLAALDFRADSANLATDSRYVLLRNSGASDQRVFDLRENREVPMPAHIAADVYSGEFAALNAAGEVSLFRPEQELPRASVLLPAEGLSPVHSIAVSADFATIAIAGEGESALFDVATGRRIASLPQFSSFTFADSSSAYLVTADRSVKPAWELEYQIDRVNAQRLTHASPMTIEATRARSPQTIFRVERADGNVSRAWTAGETRLRAGGCVLFEYAFEGLAARGLFLPQADGASSRGARLPQGIGPPFRLRVLDPANGTELWTRSFSGLPPVPFADPQGQRLILSWQAKSSGGAAAARHTPGSKEALKKSRLTDQDSFLEVLDARTGKSLGGVLVQSGASPANFDSLFSVGPAVIFSRDPGRIQVYSLADGQLKAKLHGSRPAATAEGQLLAVEADPGRLVIYDLTTLAKLDEHMLSDAIVYLHFSADGRRLLVLTENQSVFVLEMKTLR